MRTADARVFFDGITSNDEYDPTHITELCYALTISHAWCISVLAVEMYMHDAHYDCPSGKTSYAICFSLYPLFSSA